MSGQKLFSTVVYFFMQRFTASRLLIIASVLFAVVFLCQFYLLFLGYLSIYLHFTVSYALRVQVPIITPKFVLVVFLCCTFFCTLKRNIQQESPPIGGMWRNATSLKFLKRPNFLGRLPENCWESAHFKLGAYCKQTLLNCECKVQPTHQLSGCLVLFVLLSVTCDQLVVGTPYKLCNIAVQLSVHTNLHRPTKAVFLRKSKPSHDLHFDDKRCPMTAIRAPVSF